METTGKDFIQALKAITLNPGDSVAIHFSNGMVQGITKDQIDACQSFEFLVTITNPVVNIPSPNITVFDARQVAYVLR